MVPLHARDAETEEWMRKNTKRVTLKCTRRRDAAPTATMTHGHGAFSATKRGAPLWHAPFVRFGEPAYWAFCQSARLKGVWPSDPASTVARFSWSAAETSAWSSRPTHRQASSNRFRRYGRRCIRSSSVARGAVRAGLFRFAPTCRGFLPSSTTGWGH